MEHLAVTSNENSSSLLKMVYNTQLVLLNSPVSLLLIFISEKLQPSRVLFFCSEAPPNLKLPSS